MGQFGGLAKVIGFASMPPISPPFPSPRCPAAEGRVWASLVVQFDERTPTGRF